jgi:hypothetical protein
VSLRTSVRTRWAAELMLLSTACSCRAVSGSILPIICAAVLVTVGNTRRRSSGSGVHTSPARASRSTIAEVAGGHVPTTSDSEISVIGVLALMKCSDQPGQGHLGAGPGGVLAPAHRLPISAGHAGGDDTKRASSTAADLHKRRTNGPVSSSRIQVAQTALSPILVQVTYTPRRSRSRNWRWNRGMSWIGGCGGSVGGDCSGSRRRS